MCPKCVFQDSFVLTTSSKAKHHKQVKQGKQLETFFFASRTCVYDFVSRSNTAD